MTNGFRKQAVGSTTLRDMSSGALRVRVHDDSYSEFTIEPDGVIEASNPRQLLLKLVQLRVDLDWVIKRLKEMEETNV